MDASHSRREFCTQACQLAVLVVGGSLSGCGGGGGDGVTSPSAPTLPTLTAANAAGAAALTIDAASPLASVGSAALVQTSAGNLLVARTAADAFTALTAVCTHQQCTITGYASPIYVCPCHGSRYDTSGRVVNGPATRALSSYATRFANNVLTITL